MRTIKFRSWDKSKKVMTPVAGIWFGDDGSAMTITFEPAPKAEYHIGLVNGENGVLMQFTGLLDKNGKEIYEGDIANVTYAIPNKYPAHHYLYEQGMMDYTERAVLKWDNFQARYYFELENSLFEDDWKNLEVEVIGNLYEHPELLSQSK